MINLPNKGNAFEQKGGMRMSTQQMDQLMEEASSKKKKITVWLDAEVQRPARYLCSIICPIY